MTQIPCEVWAHIISHLNHVEDIVTLELVSTYYRQLCYEHVKTISHNDINLYNIISENPYINITDEWDSPLPVYIKIGDTKYRSPNSTWLIKHRNIQTLGFPILVEWDTSLINVLNKFPKLTQFIIFNYTRVDHNGLLETTMNIDQIVNILIDQKRTYTKIHLECISSFSGCHQFGIYNDPVNPYSSETNTVYVADMNYMPEYLTSILNLCGSKLYIHLFTCTDIYTETDLNECIHILNSLPKIFNRVNLKIHTNFDDNIIIHRIEKNIGSKNVTLNLIH